MLIIENKNDLIQDEDEEIGGAVVIVDIEAIHLFWTENELELAAASYREDGYWAWEISNVRPIEKCIEVPAKRKIYAVDIDLEEN